MNEFRPPVQTRQELERGKPLRELITRPVTAITATSAGAAQTILDIPDEKDFQFGDFNVCNATNTAATFSMHIVPSGGSAGNGNLIYNAESVPGNDTLTPSKRYSRIAPAGSTIQVHSGTANALNIQLWGVLISGGDPL